MNKLRPANRKSPPQGGTVVLDSAGLTAFAEHHPIARAAAAQTLIGNGQIVVAASTLTEVLRGKSRDAAIHRVLKTVIVEPITTQVARKAGELLGSAGLDGHRCVMDALVAAVALECPRPVLLLTSDVADLSALTEELARPKHERVLVHRI